jgi:hypothetical protein
MSIVLFAIVIAGFGPALVHPIGRPAPLTLVVALHGVIFAAWLVLFVVQTSLISFRKVRMHRRLGYAGVALAMLMTVTGSATAIAMAHRGFDLSGDLIAGGDAVTQLAFQLGQLGSFAILFGLGIACRRRAAVHKRMIFLATVGGLMPAPLAHVFGHMPMLRDKGPIVLVPLVMLWASHAVYDRVSRGRIHPVSLWGGVALLLWSNIIAVLIAPSPAWRHFGAWLAR